MSAYYHKVMKELYQKLDAMLTLGGNSPIWRAVQAERVPWRQLVDEFLQTGEGLKFPYVVIQQFPNIPDDDWPMDLCSYKLPMVIHYIVDADTLLTEVSQSASSSTTIDVEDSSEMFVGLVLEFGVEIFAEITAINSPTQIVVSPAITVSDGDKVRALQVMQLVDYRMEQLRDAFRRGEVFTNMQFVTDPEIDVGDTGVANNVFNEANYSVQVGSVKIEPLVGETYA